MKQTLQPLALLLAICRQYLFVVKDINYPAKDEDFAAMLNMLWPVNGPEKDTLSLKLRLWPMNVWLAFVSRRSRT